MTKSCTISAPLAMYAAGLCASKDPARPYLHGVLVQPAHPLPGAFIVATDGRRLSAYHDEAAELDGIPPEGVILPVGSKALTALKNRNAESVTWSSETNVLTVLDANGVPVCMEPCQEIKGTFPNWKRIMPDETSGEPALFNGAYLKTFADIATAHGKGTPLAIRMNGQSPAVLSMHNMPKWRGILMPMRGDAEPDRAPWVHGRTGEGEQ